MNPGGKVHEWNDLDPADLPDAGMVAGHALPTGNASLDSPDIINPMVEDLNSSSGKGGELFAKRRKRAENWVVDEGSVGVNKPSAFADKFQQQQFQQQQLEQSSVDQVRQQQQQQQQHQLQQ